MPRYVIEREVPGAGKLSDAQLKGIAEKSNQVLRDLGVKIQWVESFVTENKIYCIYLADSVDLIMEHARCGGFPADAVNKVRAVINPTTAD